MRSEGQIKHGNSRLFVREIDLNAELLLRALLRLDKSRRLTILDSGGERGEDARYLIAGFDPFEIIEASDGRLRIFERDTLAERVVRGEALDLLDQRLQSLRPLEPLPSNLPVTGACIATFSYDLARRFARLRLREPRRAGVEPDAVLAFYDTLFVHDYASGQTFLLSINGQGAAARALALIEEAALLASKERALAGLGFTGRDGSGENSPAFASRSSNFSPVINASSNFTREQYIAAVLRLKEHIAAGDIYQANLTQQLSVELDDETTPETVFMRLRRDHPASFAAFIRRREDVLVSCSPERFLRVEVDATSGERRIEAWPIKGTRPRGTSEEEDARLRAELSRSEKDRAENIMIVDLMRNDLGRVCEYGSIGVTELCAIQEHPTLFHLVSKVRGRLRAGVTVGELLRATFPCGSITGAPKLRAMELIDEAEGSVPRAISMGAIGYFSFAGSLDLSVAIRTITFKGRRARFNVGGGIVADSDPVLEYEESLVKARALLNALNSEIS